MEQVYLSRYNLLTLLRKLDRQLAGEKTLCTLIKNDTINKNYPQSCQRIQITAVEDKEYYGDRIPGVVHVSDDPHHKAS
jgi:hypothetical protein